MGVGVQGMPTLAASAVLQSSSQQGLKHYQSMAVRMRSTKEVEPCVRREELDGQLSADPTSIAFDALDADS
ncbi:hypothetical protein EXIGLDRAFT_725268 [Exidia glandulosa HHB12029]|uniref:Uncharacterized protein n=1 Tax=Exidia glandulosa HHB12029 TaxID=1314781 RepID=A0A165E3W2_EXIGL|nr:hypothetical protein EXIGLDRAFT_725268 [Exidia glandulosa HHB12029]